MPTMQCHNRDGDLHQTNKRQKWWLPILGPTSTLLAYLLARHACHGETRWDTHELARTIGLGTNRVRLWESLERLSNFKVATFVSTDVIAIRLELPALTPRQQEMLPATMADNYRQRIAA